MSLILEEALRADDLRPLDYHFARWIGSRWGGGLDELQSVLECALASADGKELEVDSALLHSGQRAS